MIGFLTSGGVNDIWVVVGAPALRALPVAAALAYLLIAVLDLREGVEAWQAGRRCAAKLLKALAHVVVFLKVVAV